jgi:arylsulfatase A-like enzyme
MKNLLKFSLVTCLLACFFYDDTHAQERPNIIYILTDDLGYGDVKAYNKEGKINTPNIDKLAKQGMRFTDAHSPSGVCTPTRYSIMTGRYPWRSQRPVGVLNGFSRPLMENDRATVASLLKENGYNTAVVGKWHLGLGWVPKREYAHLLANKRYGIDAEMNPDHVDLAAPMTISPNTNGFDYSYVLPASLDMQPYCYVENGKLVDPLTSFTPGKKPDTGYAGAFWRPGLMSPNFDFFDVLPGSAAPDQGKTFLSVPAHACTTYPLDAHYWLYRKFRSRRVWRFCATG